MSQGVVLFSIIIPLYNKERTVGESIRSVLDQNLSSLELIIVDDGSTDNSVRVVQSFDDSRIRLFPIPNSGPSAARNYGIQRAKGDWILVLDADDLLLSGAIRAFEEAIDKWPGAGMITGNFYCNDGQSRLLYSPRYQDRYVRNPFRSWFNKELMPRAGAFVCRKELMLRFPYDETLRRSEDAEMLFRFFRECPVVQISNVVMEYRRTFSAESVKQPPIEKDFKGHLSFDKKKLWEKICLYELYIEVKNRYPEDAVRLYSSLRKRYGLIISYHLAFWYRALIHK